MYVDTELGTRLVRWRHHLHQIPETGFNEHQTSRYVAAVQIKGDTRSYAPHVQALLEKRMREICQGIASAHGCTCEVDYTHEFVPTLNWPKCVAVAVRAARAVVGVDNVDENVAPMMTSEDFGTIFLPAT